MKMDGSMNGLKLLRLRQRRIPDPEGALHHFPVESLSDLEELTFILAASYSRIAPVHTEDHRTTLSAKSKCNPEVPKP